ncbi:NADH-cytochrome b5 reductase-like protein isoform X1 [Zingiber officinale]|uniref:NADH-cytochrome b5 reductase-like protein isoform X1 n=1 Tax=Zingiber officinale TaxID=94328 RepID=UPI001C4B217B|nr:NADH-cytochrome b5 reductase-like protein isoform X1 [Zingiber officinale]
MALFRRLLSSKLPSPSVAAFLGASKESSNLHRRFPFAAAAAIFGGAAVYCYSSSPTFVQLDIDSDESCIALNPEKWLEFKLQETARVSHNSQLFRYFILLVFFCIQFFPRRFNFLSQGSSTHFLFFRFSFDPTAKLGLDVASCILTRAPIGEESDGRRKYVIRPYTPISDPDSRGYFDLLIKVYPEGKMSQHFASLKPGDIIEVKGPIEKLRYSPNMKRNIGMIAGGTGITPMLQVVNAILKNPDDNTQVSLIYANISPDDILLKNELDRLSASYANFKVFYTVDKPNRNWRGGIGYVSKDMVLKGLPSPGEDTLILVCGPPGLMQHISGDKAKDRSQGELTGILKDAGYTEDMVYKF